MRFLLNHVHRCISTATPARFTGYNVSQQFRRCFGDASAASAADKYAEKIRKRLAEEGLSDIQEFKEKKKAAEKVQPIASASPKPAAAAKHSWTAPSARKDASPIKPLDAFMDVDRILSNAHGPSEIAALWTAYHAAKSSGTGRGYLSAVIPTAQYEEMQAEGLRYPTFILPLQRPTPEDVPDSEPAYEFYFMQWDAYEAPQRRDLGLEANPRLATTIFTSLAEYKLRQTYAQPHLVLTHYTDLARSHGIVLMRGELTPSGEDRYWLSQADAQSLCLGLQRFYLTGPRDAARAGLLHAFHEQPDRFDWKELIGLAALPL
ncbi:ATP11-domain-containing protein [Exidia glandulosa HHB12029]|uniref:ATP11-domain-containing protein n=1 Tax=Exidia glandulosa HHB12029 TaxID=1314781 RepID=A0A165C3Y8_EXIGL|nr:ATP11-domain-containing protein [Exidia glandulosa HHB12029]